MTILVLASALSGGGIIIYNQFLEHLKEHIGNDRYVILVNPYMLKPEIKGVTYLQRPVESKMGRLWYERFILKKKLWNEMQIIPNVVFSLQNTGCLAFRNCRQIVYYHQSLPIYPQKWSILRRDERILFLYKNIFPWIVKLTLIPKTEFIVQIPFIKRGVQRIYNIPSKNIHVCFPDIEKINKNQIKPYDFGEGFVHFIYVAGYCVYKNHSTLIYAVNEIKKVRPHLCQKLRVHLTLEKENVPDLLNLIEQNNVREQFVFEGLHSHEEILQMYRGVNALLFPSSIETLGLPLLESAALGVPILAADVPYAHEVLGLYEGGKFIDPFDVGAWASEIERLSKERCNYNCMQQQKGSSWNHIVNLIKKNREDNK